jgi:hypothetical protein
MKVHKGIPELTLTEDDVSWSPRRCRTMQQSHGTMQEEKGRDNEEVDRG